MGKNRLLAGNRSGFTLIELSIVVSIIAIIAGIGLPRLVRSRVTANENAALSTLRTIASAQTMTKIGGSIDTNRNGAGEYAYFAELAGAVPTRVSVGGVPGMGAVGIDELQPPALSQTLAQTQADALGDGVVVRSGYAFKMFLGGPLAGGVVPGVPELATGGANAGNMPDGGTAEQFWCCYAWPLVPGTSGRRVFFVNQEQTILQFANAAGVYDNITAAATIPAFDAALANGGGLNGLAAPLPTAGAPSNDGNLWVLTQ